jgi:uncharacterized protein (TIGR02996 family)
MTQDEAFLQAIIENPDDESLRLVYADYLDEQCDQRGEFIRVQCALAGLAYDDPRREALDVRERELRGPVVIQLLGARLQQVLEEPGTDDPYDEQVRRFAADQKAVPMFKDMGGCVAIRMDGQVVSFVWDEPDKPRAVKDARIWQIALAAGAEKYPEVRLLLSLRPVSSRACPCCEGSGTHRIPGIICYCGGLGWVP